MSARESDPTAALPEGLDRVAGQITADEVFGPIHSVGDRTVLTAAAVERAGGFGFGSGTGDEPDGSTGGGGGGGGGGTAHGRPVAVIEIGPDGVQVHPIIDVTRIGITVIVTLLAMWRAARRRPQI